MSLEHKQCDKATVVKTFKRVRERNSMSRYVLMQKITGMDWMRTPGARLVLRIKDTLEFGYRRMITAQGKQIKPT